MNPLRKGDLVTLRGNDLTMVVVEPYETATKCLWTNEHNGLFASDVFPNVDLVKSEMTEEEYFGDDEAFLAMAMYQAKNRHLFPN